MAEKTGWTMDYILYQLPISAGIQLCDAWASRNGCKLVWAELDMGELE